MKRLKTTSFIQPTTKSLQNNPRVAQQHVGALTHKAQCEHAILSNKQGAILNANKKIIFISKLIFKGRIRRGLKTASSVRMKLQTGHSIGKHINQGT